MIKWAFFLPELLPNDQYSHLFDHYLQPHEQRRVKELKFPLDQQRRMMGILLMKLGNF
jgi:hypothetical protein